MTGINSPYEAPIKPDLVIASNITNAEKAVAEINDYLGAADK